MPGMQLQPYYSYLIRCWLVDRTSDATAPVWRFGLRKVAQESQEVHFGTMEQLMSYLQEQLLSDAARE